jgi:hypothetical protein
MLTWGERHAIISRLAELSLNTYLYAPKEDALHRYEWRKPYPKQWRRAFSELVRAGAKSGVTVIPALSPGLSFGYCNQRDYRDLLGKFQRFVGDGAQSVALLMDDIPCELPRACRRCFDSLGQAHGELLVKLQRDLARNGGGIGLWFCPTVYTDAFANESEEQRRYLPRLAATAPNIQLLWTGSQVIAPGISARSLRLATRYFDKRVVIWDNLYANDYCPSRLFIGAYRGRKQSLHGAACGIMLNPTGLAETDQFLLGLLASFIRGTPGKAAWDEAITAIPYHREIKAIAPFFEAPFRPLPPRLLRPGSLQACRDALQPLLWKWKSALQREWYPYLHNLETTIALWQKHGSKADPEWIAKKYPPLLAALLQKATAAI